MEKSAVESESFILTRWSFFRLLGLVHLMAFGSYATQIIGLNGEHGILPTQDLLRLFSGQSLIERIWAVPTVAWFNCSDAALMTITITGVFFALLVCAGIATGPSLIALMILWLSVVSGGGDFTGFQSDGMLVEVTFLSLFFVTWRPFEPPWPVPLKMRQQTKPSLVGLWLLRFMIFRMMFASGLVKILSGDTTWHNFTAMNYHFETQPIPTPLAWYAHQLPPNIHALMVLHMYVAELLAPVLIFVPGISRLIAAAIMASLHAGIALTGNYTFLNFLSIVLCVPLVSDRWWRRIMPPALCRAVEAVQVDAAPSRLSKIIRNSLAFGMLLLASSVFGCSVAPFMVPRFFQEALVVLSPFHIADSYGLFAVMTTKRPEIVFEGSSDGTTWLPYEFKIKPGDDLKRPPPWVAPHMPRLDWRLWFAAMDDVDRSPWVLDLVKRMLENRPEIQIFFDKNPFARGGPKYIRAFVYDYHFTDSKTKQSTGQWWWRDNKRVYLPPAALVDGKLILLP